MKVAIIGAGVAGLSAGCYLEMNGFETEIFESHSRPGGLCTSWSKGDFTFDGCIHWLLGSGSSSPFFKLWSELIDMSSIHFINHDVRMEIETLVHCDRYGNNKFRLYSNLDFLEKYMCDLAPEDKKVITRFINQIRRIQEFEIPPMIQDVPKLMRWKEKAKFIRHLPLLIFLQSYRRITSYSFAGKLKNPFLKEVFQLLFDGADLPILIHTIPLAFSDKHGAGYPSGGSTTLVNKIEERYLSLGGKIHYNSAVKKIIVGNGCATGLLNEDGKHINADFVLSAADWRFTVFDALDGKYVDKRVMALGKQKKLKVYYSIFLVFLGLNRTLDEIQNFTRFPLKKPLVSPDGTTYERMELHNHRYDPALAPAGKTVVSVNLYTQKGDFWIDLRNRDKELYNKTKEEFALEVIDILDKKFGGIRETIEQSDVSTPATFQRYTNNWQGSIQGWLPGKNMIAPSPVSEQLQGLKNFYFAGHWLIPGGGLPVAIKTARDASMMICHQQGVPFRTIPPAGLSISTNP
jgi:phytoene dehydrogenase-like protein